LIAEGRIIKTRGGKYLAHASFEIALAEFLLPKKLHENSSSTHYCKSEKLIKNHHSVDRDLPDNPNYHLQLLIILFLLLFSLIIILYHAVFIAESTLIFLYATSSTNITLSHISFAITRITIPSFFRIRINNPTTTIAFTALSLA